MGRRWGKSTMAGSVALACAVEGAAVAWIAPTYKNSRPLWRFAERMTAPVSDRCVVRRAERTIEFPGGGWLGVYSADAPDSVRGEAFDLVIIDEAARVSEEAWVDAIQPTLADRDGRAYLISTPHGRNWFWREYSRADGKRVAAFTAPSSANPNPNIKRAYEMARERVSDRTFRQEWDAQFVEDGAYFRGVRDVAILTQPDPPDAHVGHSVVLGVDWGKQNDYTVITAMCRQCGRVVDWDRVNKIDYAFQRERLVSMARRWAVDGILPERNSIGEPNIEMLSYDNLPIMAGPDGKLGYMMQATNKPRLIEALALAIEKREIVAPADYALELETFEMTMRPDSRPRFGAPEGEHDDRVISLALAYHAATMGTQIFI